MENVKAVIKFKDYGNVELELFMDVPNSTANFVDLAEAGYYDGLSMHRIIPGFVAQGGCPDGTGMGGPGYAIDGDFKSNGFDNPHTHKKGAISWARSMARNSAGSQFYLTLSDVPHLDGDYAVFGEVTGGNDVLDKIALTGTNNGTPSSDVTIECVTIDRNGVEVPKVNKV